jgi:hypothetical protein
MMYGLGQITEMTKGRQAYEHRQRYRCSWSEVARDIGYCNSQSALRAAKGYAESSSSPWPLSKASKGACIYKSRKYGLTWMSIAKNYEQTIAAVQRCAYKWAKRYGHKWPPR